MLLEHSVFALPFAYIAALTAMFTVSKTVHWGQLLLVTVAMIGARSFAMAVNRIIDREFDARNPRTAKRELVTGVLSVKSAWVGAVLALAVFLTAAASLNWLVFWLAPVAALPLVVYPYGKRFTGIPRCSRWPRRSPRSARGWPSPAAGAGTRWCSAWPWASGSAAST